MKKTAEKLESKEKGGRGEGKKLNVLKCFKVLSHRKKKCRISFSFDRFGYKLCIHNMFDSSNYNVHGIVYPWELQEHCQRLCSPIWRRQFSIFHFEVEVKESRRRRPVGDIFSRTEQIQLFHIHFFCLGRTRPTCVHALHIAG